MGHHGNAATVAGSLVHMLIQLTISGSFSNMMSYYAVVLKFPPIRIEGNKENGVSLPNSKACDLN